jgi:hypothetical protein
MHIALTNRLDDRRCVEASADWRGDVLRLRARLVEADVVVIAHRRDFLLSTWVPAAAVAEFTGEFAVIAGIFLEKLFPAELFSPMCPAAPQHWPDALVWGIAAGTVDQPHVIPIPPEPITPELIAEAAPATPREVYRMAATCVKGDCPHWRDGTDRAGGDGRCSLVERVIEEYPPLLQDKLQPCGIRSVCRWFAQEGPPACRACPGVVTDLGQLPQDRESEAHVRFF